MIGYAVLQEIAQACRERLGFKVLTGGQPPNFCAVNHFRTGHLAALGGLFDRFRNIAWKPVLRLSSMLRSTALEFRRMRQSTRQ